MEKEPRKARRAVIEEANDWLVRLRDPACGIQDERLFAQWLQNSPMHVKEYLRAESCWSALEDIDPKRQLDVAALLTDSNASVVELDPICKREKIEAVHWWQRGLFVAAAVAFSLALALLWQAQQRDPFRYDTGRGEQRRLVLDDGSIVELNTESVIEVHFSHTRREVELLQGEVLFTVAKDPARPFVVTSDRATVRALGTQFNVYRRPRQTVVTVIEGRVAIAGAQSSAERIPVPGAFPNGRGPLELSAGDQAEVAADVPIRRRLADPVRALAWRERRLIFESQPLSHVVAEFNRYNKRQLTITDADLNAKKISGVFDADRPDALVRFLVLSEKIETIPQGLDGLVIQRER